MGCANFKLLQISTDSRATIVLIDDAKAQKERERERDFGKIPIAQFCRRHPQIKHRTKI
jgi:hypothetical protein